MERSYCNWAMCVCLCVRICVCVCFIEPEFHRKVIFCSSSHWHVVLVTLLKVLTEAYQAEFIPE